MSAEKIMEQAQVFASAWSVVGGPFDDGAAMEAATREKDELRRMVAELVEERDAMARALDRQTTAAERIAQQVMASTSERDALAARLAELEGQEPVAWVYDWQAPEGLIKGWVETNREAIPENANNIRPIYARPVPAEPVNARLLEALKRLSFCAQTTGGVAGRDDELCSAIEASAKAIAEAEAQQERLLQDMHDAGREIDRVMAEAAPKAARLTEAEVAAALNLFPQPSSLVLKITRAIETAVLRKNGIEVEE